MITTAMAEFGRIDVLFNNAMTVDLDSAARDTAFLALAPEIFLTSMRTTVLGGLLAAQPALPHLLAHGSGSHTFHHSVAPLPPHGHHFNLPGRIGNGRGEG